jgi:hypothetical protein
MPGIETQQSSVHSYADEVLFRWQGMTIWAGLMWDSEGRKSLSVKPVDVVDVEPTMASNTATWIILSAEEPNHVATASTTSSGSCPACHRAKHNREPRLSAKKKVLMR